MASSWSPDIFRNALDHIPDAILISDCAGAVQFANRQAPRLLGYPIEDLLGQDLERLLPESLRRSHIPSTDLLAAGTGGSMGVGRPLAICRKDGSEFPVQISLGSIADVQGTFVVATIRDLSVYLQVSRDLSLAREAAAHADRAAREARDALAAARHANAAQWTSACYLLRQHLQSLSILTGLLARGGQVDQATLIRAFSNQVDAIASMTHLSDRRDAASRFGSPPNAELMASPDQPVANLIENLGRMNASPRQSISAPAQIDHTVLVVLRDRGTLEAAAGLLRISGYSVLTARNAQEARAVALRHPEIGYVLTEQILGGSETGASVIDSLRSMVSTNLKAILISDDPVIARANRDGHSDARRIVRMPVDPEELLRMMEHLSRDVTPGSAKTPGSSKQHA